jgi:hypothetical protein
MQSGMLQRMVAKYHEVYKTRADRKLALFNPDTVKASMDQVRPRCEAQLEARPYLPSTV